MFDCCSNPGRDTHAEFTFQAPLKPETYLFELVPKLQSEQNFRFERGAKIVVSSQHPKFTEAEKYTKLSGPDYDSIWNLHKEKNTNFVDNDFPHSTASIVSGPSSPNFNPYWERISKLSEGKQTLLSQNISLDCLAHYKHHIQSFSNVIKLLGQKGLLHKNPIITKQNKEGIYAFKIRVNGTPSVVVVDDFVPLLKSKLLFSQPINHDFYIPLLEKALAKSQGAYTLIPDDEVQLLNMLTLLPYTSIEVKKLTKQSFNNIVENRQHICISTENKLEGQSTKHYFHIDHKNDKITLKKNISDSQVHVHNFTQYIQKYKTLHIWYSHQRFNSLFQTLHSNDQVYKLEIKSNPGHTIISLNSKQYSLERLVLFNANYDIVKFVSAISNHLTLEFDSLVPGNYYIYYTINPTKSSVVLNVNSLSVFELLEKQTKMNVLNKVFHNYSINHSDGNIKYLNSQKTSFVQHRSFHKELSMAYTQVFIGIDFTSKTQVQFDESQLLKNGYKIIGTLKGSNKYKKLIKQGESLIIPFEIDANKQNIVFPPSVEVLYVK